MNGSRARVVMGSAVAGLIGVVALAAMEGWFNPAQADQVYLRCDVSGLDGTIWEITLDEKAGKAWVYKPEFRSSTEYPASFECCALFQTEEVGAAHLGEWLGSRLMSVQQ